MAGAKRCDQFADADLVPGERVAQHTREVAAIQMRRSEIADGDQGDGHRQTVDQGPVPEAQLPPVESDVGLAALLACRRGEFQQVRVDVAESVYGRCRPVGDRLEGLRLAQTLVHGLGRLQGQPRRPQV
jgi:hypothetical protein